MNVSAVHISPFAKNALGKAGIGHVEGVFVTSFNVRLDGGLVHVGRSCDELSCIGLSVEPAAMDELLSGLVSGAVCVASEDALRVYRVGGLARIFTAEAELVSCSVPSLTGLGLALWASRQLADYVSRAACGLPEGHRTEAALAALAEPAGDAELEEAVSYLCGRGLGLTPSGDDVLLGYACARRAFGMEEGLGERICSMARERTTSVSASYAEAFAAGYVNPAYARALEAVRACDEAALKAAVHAILEIGHTSGADALLGLSIGFSYVVTRAASPERDGALSFSPERIAKDEHDRALSSDLERAASVEHDRAASFSYGRETSLDLDRSASSDRIRAADPNHERVSNVCEEPLVTIRRPAGTVLSMAG